ncbi:NADH-quinone oxidoreductase subunit D [Desulfotalea psychrophila]|uniref:NADH-quinone oxidoreductase subunit D n=1 Tax=Desulfotalea psychrophila (strain LSv54 / DSM 12343) TaxID=177439 RepID=NUOD_DESPS|nr:NADH-quinone oxidoreductase subunit D [Desulfotalea psychrophila]Q6ANM7.1 RecName: Full=NADH-quinone oxidoreductase subunit D; AltName: Full=NADH dehydrogenase I subunit D; AltName: Full=NDH-1 subunit D [Desulfotalea psychrophila LSv54]CAG36047.1 probable NADH dehydrogenase, subunit 7 [Desulfotalea psychrophila LSv54]
MSEHIILNPDETFTLNLGPQHPATHGVLRVKLTMDGEYIYSAETVIGYIHRMHEKMGENRTYNQYLPNLSRLDYLSAMAYCHGYVLAVEKAGSIEVPERAEYIRAITVELNRLSSHLVWFGAFIMDLGGFSPLMYAFDDREQILDLLESITGSRLTYCYYRFGGLYNDIDDEFLVGTRKFIIRMRKSLKTYRDLVTNNIILMKRLKDIGHISPEICRKYGATGPVARGSGINFDVRKNEPYSVYNEFDFDIPVYHEGDSYARYMVRMDEMEQSLRIIEQAMDKLPGGPIIPEKKPKIIKLPEGDYYSTVEAARGSFGIRLVSDGGKNAYRLKLRSPTFSNMHLFDEVCQGMLIADALALMGSLDLVIPEIDR